MQYWLSIHGYLPIASPKDLHIAPRWSSRLLRFSWSPQLHHYWGFTIVSLGLRTGPGGPNSRRSVPDSTTGVAATLPLLLPGFEKGAPRRMWHMVCHSIFFLNLGSGSCTNGSGWKDRGWHPHFQQNSCLEATSSGLSTELGPGQNPE